MPKWIPQFEDIRRYLPRRPLDPEKLVVLVWFQLALVRGTGDFGRPGEKEFFKFVRSEWECAKKSSD